MLTERQRAILELERSWWTLDEPKEVVISARFQCSIDDYYGELNRLLELPEAEALDPLVVHRLRRRRDRRRRERHEASSDPRGGAN
jgi:hypothetical protein